MLIHSEPVEAGERMLGRDYVVAFQPPEKQSSALQNEVQPKRRINFIRKAWMRALWVQASKERFSRTSAIMLRSAEG